MFALSLGIAHPLVDLPRDLLPLLLPSVLDQLPEQGVLLEGPGHLLRLLLVLRLPFVVALVVIPARD